MMQTFRVSDAVRCIVLNTPKCPNIADVRGNSPRSTTLQNLGLWKQVLTQQDNRITLASWNGIKLSGLVSARTCGGRVWELDHLYLPYCGSHGAKDGDKLPIAQETATLNLLEGLVQESGGKRAERILLRLPCGSPAVDLSRRAGFFPYGEETLLEGEIIPVSPAERPDPQLFGVRHAQDDYGLFQLFSACTPSSAKMAMGLTCEQWTEVQSLWPGNRHEWVVRQNEKIVGWLALFNHRGCIEGKIMVHPQHMELTDSLVEFALSRSGFHQWLVPSYQESIGDRLRNRGLQESARHTMLINTVAAPVMCAGMAPVEA